MFATITKLAYWKSEHDEQSCEDAFAVNPAAGLFAVADGVGTAVFSNIWARIIAKHFLTTPLLSSDPFEVDWWIRPAQEEYKNQVPNPMTLSLGARKKAQEGSFTTLVALRLVKIDADEVAAQALAFGDSCLLVHRGAPEESDFSFPLEKVADFERGPVCLPSFLKRFDRTFTICLARSVTLKPGDQVILATDAVAKWVIGGGGRGERFYADAFAEVASQTPETWPGFIQACRDSGQMADDDVTAIIVTFSRDGANGSEKLGVTTGHSPAIQAERREALGAAKERADKEMLAITFGDGAAFGYTPDTLPEEIKEARRVADALNEVLQALRGAINSPDLRAVVAPLWRKHQATLEQESCARELIESLHQIGIITAAAPGQPGPEEFPAPAAVALPEQQPVSNPAAEQQEGNQLLEDFLRAYHNDDDQAIAAAYEAILRSPLRATIALKAAEEARARQSQERLRKAEDGVNLTYLQKALQQGKPRDIASEFSSLSITLDALPATMRQVVEPAIAFANAYHDSSDQGHRNLLMAYEQMVQSDYRNWLRLDKDERRRLEQARLALEARQSPLSILGWVNGHPITAEMAQALDTLKDWYIDFRHRELGWKEGTYPGYKTQIEMERNDLRDGVQRARSWDILIEDVLIQEGLEGVGEIDIEGKVHSIFHKFQSYIQERGPLQQARLQPVDPLDIQDVLGVFVRRRLFARHLAQRGTKLRDWLKKQRKQADERSNAFW